MEDLHDLDLHKIDSVWQSIGKFKVNTIFYKKDGNEEKVSFIVEPQKRQETYDPFDIFNEIMQRYPLAYPILGLKTYNERTALNNLKGKENFKDYITETNMSVTKEKAARIDAKKLFEYIFEEFKKDELNKVVFRRGDGQRTVDAGTSEEKRLGKIWRMIEGDERKIKCNITGLHIGNVEEDGSITKMGNKTSPFYLEWDHRIPYSRKGPTIDWNIQPLCLFVNELIKQRLCKGCKGLCSTCVLAFPEENYEVMGKDPILSVENNVLVFPEKGYKQDSEEIKEFIRKCKKCSEIITKGGCKPKIKAKCPEDCKL
ncbi:MAG: HNH endonuclease [Candidatus Odinarchaeota archaeon]